MTVYIDTHTHALSTTNPFSVVNLSVADAASVLQTSSHKFFSVGIHPWDVHESNPSAIEQLEILLSDTRIKAIGECGLDKNAKAPCKEQEYYFLRQVQLSEKFKKPLIIHCVASFNELIVLHKKLKPTQNWIFHGFRAKPMMAKQLLDHGFSLSYGKNFNALSVELTPLEKLCIETDASDLQIADLYKTIAGIKNCQPSELNAACALLRLYVC